MNIRSRLDRRCLQATARRVLGDTVARPAGRPEHRPPALLAGGDLPFGLRARQGDPALPAILGLATVRRARQRADLARLPQRSLEPGRRHVLASCRGPGLGKTDPQDRPSLGYCRHHPPGPGRQDRPPDDVPDRRRHPRFTTPACCRISCAAKRRSQSFRPAPG